MTSTFFCSGVETFDLADLRAWVGKQRAAGEFPAAGTVSIEVVHRDREMDGSCRWCGCRKDEVIDFER